MSNCNCSNCKNNGTQICSVCCSYQGYADRWEAKPKTNADRVRAMSDAELAREFTRLDMFCCPVSGVNCAKEPKCQDCFKRWLEQEAKT